MAGDVEILTREDCLPDNIAPTGRQYGVALMPDRALYHVKYVDGGPGELPDELKGAWTTPDLALKDVQRYLKKIWDLSDQIAAKSARKEYKQKVANGQLEAVGD